MLNIYLFGSRLFAPDGGGDGAGAAPSDGPQGTAAATGDTVPDAAEQIPQPRRRGKPNPFQDVKFGKPTQEAAEEPAQQTAQEQETRRSIEEIVKSDEYKDEAQRYFQGLLSARLKGREAKDREYETLSPALDRLADFYGARDEHGRIDAAKLAAAVDQDDRLIEDQAAERGVSNDTERFLLKQDRELRELRAREQQRQQDEQDRIWYEGLRRQEAQMQQTVPGFNLDTEMQNKQFAFLVSNGFGVDSAFKAVHHDEIMANQGAFIAQQAAQKIANAVQANGRRPTENGTGNKTAAGNTKWLSDPAKLTKEERAELRKRAARGEEIVW